MPTHTVTIQLLNYNSSEYTIRCVESILEKTNPEFDYSITVVDNGSRDAEKEKLTRLPTHLRLKVVWSNYNRGFAGGHTFGIVGCDSKYYFFLNNDTILMNDVVGILYRFCEANTDVGLCGGQIYSPELVTQPSFHHFPTPMVMLFGDRLMCRLQGKGQNNRGTIYKIPMAVDLVSGAGMFIPSELFHAIGGFDTSSFLYCEEEELALQVRKQNRIVCLVPDAKIIHHERGSVAPSFELKREYYISLFQLYRKHYGIFKTAFVKWLLALSLYRRGITNRENRELAMFILDGAPETASLRYNNLPPK